jgi:hypothetical protein
MCVVQLVSCIRSFPSRRSILSVPYLRIPLLVTAPAASPSCPARIFTSRSWSLYRLLRRLVPPVSSHPALGPDPASAHRCTCLYSASLLVQYFAAALNCALIVLRRWARLPFTSALGHNTSTLHSTNPVQFSAAVRRRCFNPLQRSATAHPVELAYAPRCCTCTR